jgi:hypothetical protein
MSKLDPYKSVLDKKKALFYYHKQCDKGQSLRFGRYIYFLMQTTVDGGLNLYQIQYIALQRIPTLRIHANSFVHYTQVTPFYNSFPVSWCTVIKAVLFSYDSLPA